MVKNYKLAPWDLGVIWMAAGVDGYYIFLVECEDDGMGLRDKRCYITDNVDKYDWILKASFECFAEVIESWGSRQCSTIEKVKSFPTIQEAI